MEVFGFVFRLLSQDDSMQTTTAPRASSAFSQGLNIARWSIRRNSCCPAPRASSKEEDTVHPERRRVLSGLISGLALCTAYSATPPAFAGGMGAYLKKKTLDPLDTYVAPLIAAKDELKSSCSVAATDAGEARSMLRSGALSGFRMNARAVGEYSERLETSTNPKKLVDDAIGSLEKYDSALLLLSRDQPSKEDIKDLVSKSLSKIDDLLETVPRDVMRDVTGESAF